MVLDSNILISYLNGEQQVIKHITDWRKAGKALLISSISSAEVLSLPALTPTDMASIKDFLDDFIAIPFDNDLAEVTAVLRRNYGLLLPDAGIAATALANKVPLVTRDKNFKKIQEITVIEL